MTPDRARQLCIDLLRVSERCRSHADTIRSLMPRHVKSEDLWMSLADGAQALDDKAQRFIEQAWGIAEDIHQDQPRELAA